MTNYYKIANTIIKYTANDKFFVDLPRNYKTSNITNVDMDLLIDVVEGIDIPTNLEFKNNVSITKDGDFFNIYHINNEKAYLHLIFNKNYTKCKLILDKKFNYNGLNYKDLGYLFSGMLFQYMLSFKSGIVIHGSSIKFDDNAIIFTAPSGVGKSTHTKLWLKKFGSRVSIINDDKPALRFDNGNLLCFGTPFSGKEYLNANDCAKVKAIVNIVRGNKNRLERLNTKESITLLLEETNRDELNNEVNINNIKNISNIIKSTNIYRLYCRPDIDAVEVCYKGIFKRNEED